MSDNTARRTQALTDMECSSASIGRIEPHTGMAGQTRSLRPAVHEWAAAQEWMGHKDFATTLIYADYAPSAHEADLVDAAFGRGTNLGTNLSETEPTSHAPRPAPIGA
jgi:site-specific recombinase XerC